MYIYYIFDCIISKNSKLGYLHCFKHLISNELLSQTNGEKKTEAYPNFPKVYYLLREIRTKSLKGKYKCSQH